jgi:hypothetical protein
MEFLFFGLLLIMLMIFGYAQLQKGVVKLPGKLTVGEEEDIETD